MRKSAPGRHALKELQAERGRSSKKAEPPPLASMRQSLRQILPYLQSGDLVMLRSESLAGRVLQNLTHSDFCHLGVVLRLPELPHTPLLLEADPDVSSDPDRPASASLHVVDLRSRLSTWLDEDPSGNQAVVRRLQRPHGAPAPDASTLLQLAATQQVRSRTASILIKGNQVPIRVPSGCHQDAIRTQSGHTQDTIKTQSRPHRSPSRVIIQVINQDLDWLTGRLTD
jgi:hypothetical protein